MSSKLELIFLKPCELLFITKIVSKHGSKNWEWIQEKEIQKKALKKPLQTQLGRNKSRVGKRGKTKQWTCTSKNKLAVLLIAGYWTQGCCTGQWLCSNEGIISKLCLTPLKNSHWSQEGSLDQLLWTASHSLTVSTCSCSPATFFEPQL